MELLRPCDARNLLARPEPHRQHDVLLVEQIEFADVVVLNKTDIAAPGDVALAKSIIRALNADARIVETDHGKVKLADILDTGLFSFDAAHQHPTWFK
ncbi:hypothetical protein MXD81_55275, partial [Microbacteriaceae bacterium K1510]|nr:hypothetical protein [Microbacteriaceae bacterium K1510]